MPDDDDIKSVAVDPDTDVTEHLPGTIVRHSVPKLLSKAQFQASVLYRSADCQVLLENSSTKEEPCGPCASTSNAQTRAQRRKKKISSTPANGKAALAACGAEKMRATVKLTMLQCKQLEDKIQELETRIAKDTVGVSESLEKDLLN